MIALLALLLAADPAYPPARAAKWEPEIAKIAARFAKEPPAAGSVLFLGSSSIRLWDTAKMLPELKPANAGFGGSEVRDVTHFLDRLAPAARPKLAVVYAGDNDIADKRSPEQVRDDSRALVAALRAKYPGLPVLFLGVKASIARVNQLPQQTAANKLVAADCAADSALKFLDTAPLTRGKDGQPDPRFFAKDGLHLSPAGYAQWNAAMNAALADWPAK
jgi:lysophospholipase L1-like esterase